MKPNECQKKDAWDLSPAGEISITPTADSVRPARTELADEPNTLKTGAWLQDFRRIVNDYEHDNKLAGYLRAVDFEEQTMRDLDAISKERDALRDALKACVAKMDDLASKLSACRDALPIESPLINLTAFDYQQESEQARAALTP